jgi:alpha 1,3-glucosidase
MTLTGLAALALSLMAQDVNGARFKTCSDSSFCRRYRTWKAIPERPVLSVVSVREATEDPNSNLLHIDLRLQSSAENEANYGVELSLSRDSGFIRITIDDITNKSGRKRYRVPNEDIIVNESRSPGDTSPLLHRKHLEGSSVFSIPGLYSVEVMHSNFQLKISNKWGEVVQIMNSQNFFAFEKYRLNSGDNCLDGTSVDMTCHPHSDLTDLWEETFHGFTDVKMNGPSAVGLDVELVNSESVFGLPEHTLPFNLKSFGGEEIRFFNADVFKHPLNSPSALYGSIPMLTSIHGQSVSAVLWMNPSDTFVSLEKRGSSIESTWVSETGVVDLAIFVGPSPDDILKQLHSLTGKPILPPIFSIGFQQSKWGYSSEEEVDEVSSGFLDYKIPVDVIWLDIQHTNGNRYMTWNSKYSHPDWLTERVSGRGQKLVAIIDPHIKVDETYSIYKTLKNYDSFVKDGPNDFIGQCWPGPSSYLDLTRKDVRDLWGSLLSYSSYTGSSPNLFVWNDMNEPSVFDGPEMSFPRSLLHNGGTVEHREMHNMYGQYYHRATFEGLIERDGPNLKKRPFVLSRSFFVGSHRYGPIWTGDNIATWEFLRISVPMLLSLSISGQSFAGADVGGFDGDPTSELFIRWHQLGAMAYPFYRCHSASGTKRREPWMFDQATLEIVRTTIQNRYALLPYWYTAFGLHAIEGLPIIRPLWNIFLSDPNSYRDSIATEEQIMVGNSLLVRPVLSPAARTVEVYLPGKDEIWYDFYSPSSPAVHGGQRMTVPVSLQTIPVFVRGGSIIPLKLVRRDSTKDMKDDPLTLRIFPVEGKATGLLYVDDEASMDYKDKADYALIELKYDNGVLRCERKKGARKLSEISLADVEVFGGGDSVVCHKEINMCTQLVGLQPAPRNNLFIK